MRSPSRWVLCLAVVLGFALAGDSSAGPPKVDLTKYLDYHPVPGDFKVYDRDDGETLRSEVLEILAHKKSTELLSEITEAADEQFEIDEIVHGKESRAGAFWAGDVTFFIRRGKRVQSFRVVPGKPAKFKVPFTVYFQDQRAGKATFAGTSAFVGFEPIETPLAVFSDTAHFHRETVFTVKVGGSVFQTVTTADSWVSLEFGTVHIERVSHFYEDGAFVETEGPFEYDFSHGQHDGVPYP